MNTYILFFLDAIFLVKVKFGNKFLGYLFFKLYFKSLNLRLQLSYSLLVLTEVLLYSTIHCHLISALFHRFNWRLNILIECY